MKLARHRSLRAFTLIELFICVALFILLAAMLLPFSRDNRSRAPRINCTNNLKQVGLAFRTWALDHNDRFPEHVSITNGGVMELVSSGLAYLHYQVQSNELSTPKILVCPGDKERTAARNFATNFNNQKLSYFAGVDLVESNWSGFLSGDRSITNASGIKGHILTLTTNEPFGWTAKIHSLQGNIGLVDGSVQGYSMNGLRTAVRFAGTATNRLAMP